MKYDYIIAGGGCAGLSMAWHLLHYGPQHCNILLIEPDPSPAHSKTWCFWTRDEMPFAHLACKTWRRMAFEAFGRRFEGALDQYPYRCIRETDYRHHILDEIRQCPRIDILASAVTEITGAGQPAAVTESGTYKADYIFQSCFGDERSGLSLKQHFTGWEIRTQRDCLDPEQLTLMDFNTSQKKGLTFFYTLPFSARHGLVEYTLFSEHLLEKQEYERALEMHIRDRLGIMDDEYEIIRSEHGCIPMAGRTRPPDFGERVITLGTAGGLTKPSTGYAFTRIHKQCRQIADSLTAGAIPCFDAPSAYRFRIYDILLLQIIRSHPEDAIQVFHRLFTKNGFDAMLQFLDEKTGLAQELGMFTTVPCIPFLRAIYTSRRLILTGA
ncbi:MAG: lycopene cyclase family protein [Balneolales bacterium]